MQLGRECMLLTREIHLESVAQSLVCRFLRGWLRDCSEDRLYS
jgi:hypothetical protein